MIFGLRGSGKSNWLQWLLSEHEAYRNALVYDMCREHSGLDRYIPENRNGEEARTEAGEVVQRFIVDNARGLRPDLLVGEELSRYAPNGGGTPDALMDLIDLARHYNVGFIGVARRPAKVNTTLIELADNILIFRLTGKRDVKRLNNEAPGAGDAARDLDEYHYLQIDQERRYTVHSPVPEMDTTGEL